MVRIPNSLHTELESLQERSGYFANLETDPGTLILGIEPIFACKRTVTFPIHKLNGEQHRRYRRPWLRGTRLAIGTYSRQHSLAPDAPQRTQQDGDYGQRLFAPYQNSQGRSESAKRVGPLHLSVQV